MCTSSLCVTNLHANLVGAWSHRGLCIGASRSLVSGGGAATSEATKVEVRAGEVIASPGCRGSGRPGLVWPGFWADSAVHGHFCSETIVLRYNTGLMWTRPERRCAETDYGSQRAAPPPRHPLSLKQSILGNNLQLTRHSRSAHVLSVRNLMRNT